MSEWKRGRCEACGAHGTIVCSRFLDADGIATWGLLCLLCNHFAPHERAGALSEQGEP